MMCEVKTAWGIRWLWARKIKDMGSMIYKHKTICASAIGMMST
jgi:hypothetical protein